MILLIKDMFDISNNIEKNNSLYLTKKKKIIVSDKPFIDRDFYCLTLKRNDIVLKFLYYVLKNSFEDKNVILNKNGINSFTKSSIGYEYIKLIDLKNIEVLIP